MDLRGEVSEVDYLGRAGTDGMPAYFAVRGRNPQGDASETFAIKQGAAHWKSPIDGGKLITMRAPSGGPSQEPTRGRARLSQLSAMCAHIDPPRGNSSSLKS